MNTTIKTVTDCDYLIYMDKDLVPIGYELTMDERQALSVRYHADEEISPTLPEKTIYILEIFGIHTTLVWLVDEKEKKGELLFYKPNMLGLAREVTKTLDCALEVKDYMEMCLAADKRKDKNLPSTIDKVEEELIQKLPFTNWMEIYWNTPTWMTIWRARPDLQMYMSDFARLRTKERLNRKE